MSQARLRELRLVGFKSFAERTVVRLGPGISAIVGPNGSGKSNLADALRWALGEQGRALRTRRAEDVIFAGSASRRALGMADVSLLIDNGDRLLPVDFGEVELSRRLYRSGENEYLINRQRIRLRDLVDLLDDANIADNAFLFIGQGMVDQALALRPEERRPLFEEAAGIRKHERRRRRAESELAEAEGNLERVRDLLAELRPQARRLQAQAEQQEARQEAGAQLAAALVEAARHRLGAAERESRHHATTLAAARREADAALGTLRDAEEAAAGLARALSERADLEQQLRATLDAARGRLQEARLAEAGIVGEGQALARERARVASERAAAASRADEARRLIAAILPEPDRAADDTLEWAERRLADALRDADELRGAGRADEERAAGTRATRERLAADAERAASRAVDAQRRLREQEALASAAQAEAAAQSARAEGSRVAGRAAQGSEAAADRELAAARVTLSEAQSSRALAAEAQASLRASVSGLVARRDALDGQLVAGPDEAVVQQARTHGGRRFRDGLEAEPRLRLAVEAALGDVMAGLVLDADGARALAEAAAVIVLRDASNASPASGDRRAARLEEAVLRTGGGTLASALRRDPDGYGARLVARCLWTADLATALDLRGLLPPGWRLVTVDGVIVDDVGVVRPAPAASLLERRAARDDIARQLERAASALANAEAQASRAEEVLASTRRHETAAREALDGARRSRRMIDEEERVATAAAENASRERAWQAALLERVRAEVAVTLDEARLRSAESTALDAAADGASSQTEPGKAALAALDERVGSLRTERDGAARIVAEARMARERALEGRRRAEVALGLAQARLDELDAEEMGITGREADAAAARERLAGQLAAAVSVEERESSAFEASVATARDERQRLLATEAQATAARERLRLAEQRSRHSEVAEMEARLQVDAAREGLLVELASIGEDGLKALLAETGQSGPGDEVGGDELPTVLEHALDAALTAWRATDSDITADGPTPPALVAPTAPTEPSARARIAALRRRFNELGASNPFAARELAELRDRLDSVEAQRQDLERAIGDTRELIRRLETLMTEQFRITFQALEGAFGRRFEQLFGGGDAQLTLTDPEDLAATGVEITARPPGKKRQPLAMLSGGERALTAVALLLAMLEVRPVPFCVLDEVDAALDEANIGRFAAALRSLAQDIQFVVITHNRGTIEAADALYGVTVGDDAVSRVLSLRLADMPAPEDVAVGSVAG